MSETFGNFSGMPKTIQIRNIPEDLHRALKDRAAQMGMTLSGYLLSEIEQVAAKPTMKEWPNG